jgi:hypothetical protein
MKRLFVTASLLATWYLITPPWSQPGKFDSQASLSKWDKVSFYDSSAACEADKHAMLGAPGAAPEYAKFFAAAQCVADGDPRFKS